MRQKIIPSVMAKNQQELNQYFKKFKGIVKNLHLDIVDGKFAPNKVMMFPFRLSKEFSYNAHLMMKNPLKFIEKNINKIDLLIPQFEEIKNPHKYIDWMKSKKKKVAFALNPETKVTQLIPYLKEIDYILVLTVHPGFYGSKFLPQQLKKVKQIKKINPKVKVIVDGGITTKNIHKVAEADNFISGSFIKNAKFPKVAIKQLLKESRI
jgi:ribulose-phosphate 3-epimerase